MKTNKPWSEISKSEKEAIVNEFLNGIRSNLLDDNAIAVHVEFVNGLPPHNFGRDKVYTYNATDTIAIKIEKVKEA